MRRAIIYGTGNYYTQHKDRLPEDLKIVAYADSNPNNATLKNGELFQGLPILSPEEIRTVDYDVIYICTESAAGNQIFQKLVSEKIDSSRIFFLNRLDMADDWQYTATTDQKGYLSTIEGITIQERYLTDFDIVNEVMVCNSYGFVFTNDDWAVIDIGMNIAIASLYFARIPMVKKVYGFEAFPDTYEQAIANISLNSPEIRDKIVAKNLALSNENGKKRVAVSVEETGWRNIFSEDESVRQVEIECRDAGEAVKEILDKHKEKIVLKIDTEGAEYPIFDALDRLSCFEKIDVIMMEYHGRPENLVLILQKYGYKIFKQGKKTVGGLIYAVK